MRKFLLFIFTFFTVTSSFAQTKYFYGILVDSITLLPVSDVNVFNKNTGEKDVTNDRGIFLLKGNLDDTISIMKVDYWQQYFILNGNEAAQDTVRIMIIPKVHELKSVIVSAYSYKDYQHDSASRRQNFKEIVGYAHHYFESSNSGSGIGFSLDRLFGKKEKRQRKAFKFFQQNEEERYINFRFNPILIHSLTGLREAKLNNFIEKYQPSYKWLREHPANEDILYYVNDKLKQMHGKN